MNIKDILKSLRDDLKAWVVNIIKRVIRKYDSNDDGRVDKADHATKADKLKWNQF